MPTRVPAPDWVPLFNTSLIVISGLFLLLGYYFIRQRQIVRRDRPDRLAAKQQPDHPTRRCPDRARAARRLAA